MNEAIFDPESKKYLMYACPSEGAYGYKLIEIGSRYNDEPIQLSEELIEKVLKEASPHYPILIVDGYSVDSLLDEISLGKAGTVIKAFGEHPRKILLVGGEKSKDSIEGFKEYFCSSKAVARMLDEELNKVIAEMKEIEAHIEWHRREMLKHQEEFDKTVETLSELRIKWAGWKEKEGEKR